MNQLTRALIAGAAGAAATASLRSALATNPPGGADHWTRRNYAGRDVSLLGGPAYVAGTLVALAATASGRHRVAMAGAITCAGVVGLYDDLAGSGTHRGLAGHLSALSHGEVTTGSVKIAGLVGAGAIVAAVTRSRQPLLTTALVAGGSNLANLFDVRPGRALKASIVAGLPALHGPAAVPTAAAMGAAAAMLPADLGERSMLGDAGAGALGAAIATGIAARSSGGGLGRAVGVVVGLTALSEVISFSKVIAAVPALRALDELGRRREPSAPEA